jgi:hypothetical protein
VELRIAFPGDAKEVRKLWEYCFDDPIEFNDWFLIIGTNLKTLSL